MLRARRYRVFIVFTTIVVLVIFHFARSRTWGSPPQVIVEPPKPQSPPPPADNNGAPHPPHAFIPEIPSSPEIEKPAIPGSKTDNFQAQKPADSKESNEKPTPVPSTKPAVDKPTQEEKEPASSQNKPVNYELESGSGGEGRVEAARPQPGQPASHWKKLPEHFPVDPQQVIKLPSGKSKSLPKLQAKFKDESVTDRMTRLQRLATVKEAFEHAWTGYKKSAMGHDELEPLRGGFRDPFNGWGATLVDTLDTLWIMDLREDFSIAVDEIKKIDFTTSARDKIPVFETAIRYLGGLLGAYDISGHKYTALLDKAVELADILIGAFDTPNRMPMLFYKWAPEAVSQPHLADSEAVLAEIGSLSIEFTRLAQLTREDKYYDAIARITNELEKLQDSTSLPGLWPLKIDASGCRKSMVLKPADQESPQGRSPAAAPSQKAEEPTPTVGENYKNFRPGPTDIESYKNFIGRRDSGGLGEDAQPADYEQMSRENTKPEGSKMVPSDKNCKEGLISAGSTMHTFGMGALADSTYEYLPKEYMLLGGVNEQYRRMYEKAMSAAREYLLFQPMVKGNRDVRFLSTVMLPKNFASMDRGNWPYAYEGTHLACFAGGMFGVGAKLFGIDGDMDIAAKLTDGCVWAYESTTTGIMPEVFELIPCEKGKPCTWNETLYRDALDPQGEQRIRQAEKQYELRYQFAKDAENEAAEAKKPAPESPPGAGGRQAARAPPLGRRDRATPPTPTTDDASVTERNVQMPEKPMVLPHEEFVDARIQDERIPPGFVSIEQRKYLLRPEAIESVFLMYRLTGENYWREKGWKMFEAITKHTRTTLANSAIHDVTSQTPRHRPEMESFWLAETLKYFYLLFSDPSVVSLDEYVL